MYCVHMYRIIHPVLRMQSVEILFFQNNVTNSIAMDMFSCLRNGGNWLDLGNFIKSLINWQLLWHLSPRQQIRQRQALDLVLSVTGLLKTAFSWTEQYLEDLAYRG